MEKNTISEAAPARPPWGLVILLGSLTAMGPLGIDMYLPSLPAIGRELAASPGQTQTTLAAFIAGMALGQFLYGPAADRVGRRLPILVGVSVFTIGSIGCALAPSAELLILARFVQALGGCAGGVVARAVVRDRFGHTETARVLSLMMLIMGLAPIIAPLLGGFILLAGGWRSIFWTMAAFGAVIGLAALFRMQESRSEETAQQARSENPVRSYGALLRQPRLVGYAMAGALNSATLFTWIATSPDLLIVIYKTPLSAFGWLFGLNSAALIGGSQINRWLLRTRTPDQVLAGASLTAAGLALLLTAAAVSGFGGKWSVLPLLFLLLGSYGFLQGNTTAGALSVDPRRAGSTSALLGAMSFGVGAVAATLSGLLHDGTPRPMALTILASMVGSAVVLRLLAFPKRV